MDRSFSVDDLVGGIWRLGQAGVGRSDSEAAFQELLKGFPSTNNLAAQATPSGAADCTGGAPVDENQTPERPVHSANGNPASISGFGGVDGVGLPGGWGPSSGVHRASCRAGAECGLTIGLGDRLVVGRQAVAAHCHGRVGRRAG